MSPSPHRSPPSPAAVQALARVSVAAGDLVRAERSRRKLTLRELAARAGVAAAREKILEGGHAVPYQHYQCAGRAGLLAWERERRSLLHVENRTRFPNL